MRDSRSKHPGSRSWIVVGALAVLAGCGSNENLSDVTGVVMLDGRPLSDAMVVFSPTGAGTTSYGRTDSEGRYRMMFRDNEYGAWLGENVVRITTFDLGAGDQPGKKEVVPVVYNARSTLKVQVEPGGTSHDFELKSDAGKVVQGPKE